MRPSGRPQARVTCGIISRYDLGRDERAGLELFYRYAAEAGVVDSADTLRF